MQPAVVWVRGGFAGRHQRLDLFRIPFLGLAEGPYCEVRTAYRRDKVAGSRRVVERRPPPHGCGGRLFGAVGNGDRKPPSRHRDRQRQLTRCGPEAQPIFRGGHDMVIYDMVRVLTNASAQLGMCPISSRRDHHRDRSRGFVVHDQGYHGSREESSSQFRYGVAGGCSSASRTTDADALPQP